MAQHMAAPPPYVMPGMHVHPHSPPHPHPHSHPHSHPHYHPHYAHAMHQAGAATNKAFKTLFLVIGIFVAVTILLSFGITILVLVLNH